MEQEVKQEQRGWLMSLVYVDMSRRKRMLKREAWIAIVLSYVLTIASFLLPGSFDTSSGVIVAWTWAMMLVRVLYFHIGIGLLVIGAIALWKGQRKMALCCVPLVLVAVLWPWMNVGNPSPVTSRGPTLRTISANLLMVNQDTGPILDEIAAADADVVFLQEYTDHWDKACAERLGATYPHRIVYPQEDSFGAAIYSKHPFTDSRRDSTIGNWDVVQLSATIAFGEQELHCWNIHLVPPRTWAYTIEHLDEMREFENRLKTIADKKVIIAGDFNFSGSTLQARALEETGFHDAFVQAGAGRGATWPVNGFFRYLPGIRLDHIFLSPSLACRSIRTGIGSGSDHRPLIAEIEIP